MRDTITIGDVELNRGCFCVVVAGEEIPVTLYEFRILQYLMTHTGETQSHAQIIAAYRGAGASVGANHLYVHISNINQKLGFRFIAAVRGVGYVVREQQGVRVQRRRPRAPNTGVRHRAFGAVAGAISPERDSHGKTKYCQQCGIYIWKKYDHRRSTTKPDLCDRCGGDAVREEDVRDVPAIDPRREGTRA